MEDIVAILTPVWILIVIFGFIAYMKKMKYRMEYQRNGSAARIDDLARRMEKIERRMANLETIVLDAEKAKNFERSL